MRDFVKRELVKYARTIPPILSDPKQNPNNTYGKEFELDEIRPLSENTAAVICRCDQTGKRAAVFVFWVERGKRWWRLVPTDAHVLGMSMFAFEKLKIEADNFYKMSKEGP